MQYFKFYFSLKLNLSIVYYSSYDMLNNFLIIKSPSFIKGLRKAIHLFQFVTRHFDELIKSVNIYFYLFFINQIK
jgi:hypothetical protein